MSEQPANTIRILGCPWSITRGAPVSLQGRWGFCDPGQQRIEYSGDLCPGAMAETIFHEILHACDLSTCDVEGALKEDQISRLSSVLFGVMRDNPEIFQKLLREKSDA